MKRVLVVLILMLSLSCDKKDLFKRNLKNIDEELTESFMRRDVDLMDELLDRGVSVDRVILRGDHVGKTILIGAVEMRSVKHLKLLIKKALSRGLFLSSRNILGVVVHDEFYGGLNLTFEIILNIIGSWI